MAIGTSHGAIHEDEFRMEAHPWFVDPKDEAKDNIGKTPEQIETDKQLDKVEQREIGIEI